MSSLTLPPEAAAYLAELERELADIPSEERDDLLEEVASLLEAGDEPVARLGTPERFAAELRASAGLPPAPTAPAPPKPSAWQRFKDDPATQATLAGARELAPIWWAARALLVVAVLSVGSRESYSIAFPRLTGHPALDVALVGLAVAASVALGLAGRRHPHTLRRLRIAVNVALVAGLAFVPQLVDEARGRVEYVFPSVAAPPAGLANNGVSLRNVYPYDRKGRLLHDVRLYDQDGLPLNLGAGAIDPDRRAVATKAGGTVFNAFPIRYFDPGTRKVAHPYAVPEGLAPKPLR